MLFTSHFLLILKTFICELNAKIIFYYSYCRSNATVRKNKNSARRQERIGQDSARCVLTLRYMIMREMCDISKMLSNNCCELYLNVESTSMLITSRGLLFEESCENVRSLLGL